MVDKVQKIREEVERLKEIAEYNISHSKMDRSAWMQQVSVCTNLLSFINSLQEEPKECMYSKDNYTDEDRKVLCESCEEECRFKKKDEIKSVHAQHTTISSSLNDYLCKAYNALYKENGGILSFARLQNMAIDITEWQKEQMMIKAVEIAREEIIEKVCEYIASNMRCDGYTLQTKSKFIKDLKQAMKDE